MPPEPQNQRILFRPTAAFSLVEVAMALAIVTFSLVGLLGMVPVALNNFRSAMDATIGAQIAQSVVTDSEQTDFDRLIASAEQSGAEFFVLPTRYFDDQGSEVSTADKHAGSKAIYQVRVRGSQPGPADTSAGGNGFTSLPGETRFRPRDSVFLTVQVAWHPGLAPLPVDEVRQLWPDRAAPISTFRAVITRNGTLREFRRP